MRKAATSLGVAILSILGLVPAVAQAQDRQVAQSVTFGWAAPDSPAWLFFPLPEDVSISGIEAATVDSEAQVVVFGVSADPRRMELGIAVESGTAETFESVTLHYENDESRNIRTGLVEVVTVDEFGQGQLRAERHVTAPAAGELLTTVLRNTGTSEIDIEAVHYLPAGLQPGRLLARVTTEPDSVLQEVDETLDPITWQVWRRGLEVRPEPPVNGFEWISPDRPELSLSPGEVAVLLWLPDALPQEPGYVSYELRPVVVYANELGETHRLGLPVPVDVILPLDTY